METFLMPLIVVIVIFFAQFFVVQFLNLSGTIIVGCQKLSIPHILGGGEGFGLPSIMPTSSNSPLAIYYGFFIIAVVLFVVFLIINAFRHLAIGGKFEEQKNPPQSVGQQFKGLAVLVVMTFVTPFLIGIVFSAVSVGISFLMNLILDGTLFYKITDNDFNALGGAVQSDISSIGASPQYTGNLQEFMNYLLNHKSEIDAYFTSQQFDSQSVDLGWKAVDTLNNNPQDIFNQGSDIYKGMYVPKFNDNPFTVTILNNLTSELSKLFTPNKSAFSSTPTFYGAGQTIFGSADTTASIDVILSGAGIGPDTQGWTPNCQQVIDSGKGGTGLFNLIGYGYNTNLNSRVANGCVLLRLKGTGSYDINGNQLSLYQLTFENGEEAATIKTCPFSQYCIGIISICGNGADMNMPIYMAQTVGGEDLVLTIEAFILIGMVPKNLTVMDITLPNVLYVAAIIGFLTTLIPFISMIAFVIAGIMILKILVMGCVQLIKCLLDAMMYFFLLLPACVAGSLDKGQTYIETGKIVAGKICYNLLVGFSLLMISIMITQVATIYTMLTDGGVGDGAYPQVDVNTGTAIDSIISGALGSIANFVISIPGLIKFIIVYTLLLASQDVIEKVGIKAFGELAYGNYYQKATSGMGNVKGGFMMAKGLTFKVGMGAGKFVGRAVKGRMKSNKDARDAAANGQLPPQNNNASSPSAPVMPDITNASGKFGMSNAAYADYSNIGAQQAAMSAVQKNGSDKDGNKYYSNMEKGDFTQSQQGLTKSQYKQYLNHLGKEVATYNKEHPERFKDIGMNIKV